MSDLHSDIRDGSCWGARALICFDASKSKSKATLSVKLVKQGEARGKQREARKEASELRNLDRLRGEPRAW